MPVIRITWGFLGRQHGPAVEAADGARKFQRQDLIVHRGTLPTYVARDVVP